MMETMSIYEAIKKNGDCEEELHTLELPVYLTEGKKMSTSLSSKLMAYSSLIKKYASTLGFDNKQISLLNKSIQRIISIIKKIEKAEFDNAYSEFNILFSQLKNVFINKDCQLNPMLFVPTKDLETKLFRARQGDFMDKSIEEAYHVPLSKNYKCKTFRFSEYGYPMLYLSQTEKCARYEFKDAEDITTYIFELKENDKNDGNKEFEWKILDLAHPYSKTAYNMWTNAPKIDEGKEAINSFIRHLFWPIIAACYCIYDSSQLSDESYKIERTYKAEYVFPQFLSRYLREHHPYISGIRYFTVRNENLDSTSTDWTNYALFTNFSNAGDRDYDLDLLNRFIIKKNKYENLSELQY